MSVFGGLHHGHSDFAVRRLALADLVRSLSPVRSFGSYCGALITVRLFGPLPSAGDDRLRRFRLLSVRRPGRDRRPNRPLRHSPPVSFRRRTQGDLAILQHRRSAPLPRHARLAEFARFPHGPRHSRVEWGIRHGPKQWASIRARSKSRFSCWPASLAAIAGWLYAHFQRFINPTPFSLNQGIEYLFMAVVGGASTLWGALVGFRPRHFSQQWLQAGLAGPSSGTAATLKSSSSAFSSSCFFNSRPDGLTPRLARLFGLSGIVPARSCKSAAPSAAREGAHGCAASGDPQRPQIIRRRTCQQGCESRSQCRRGPCRHRTERRPAKARSSTS